MFISKESDGGEFSEHILFFTKHFQIMVLFLSLCLPRITGFGFFGIMKHVVLYC